MAAGEAGLARRLGPPRGSGERRHVTGNLCIVLDRRVGLIYVGLLGPDRPGAVVPEHTLSAAVMRHQGGWRLKHAHLRGGSLSSSIVDRIEALAAAVDAAA